MNKRHCKKMYNVLHFVFSMENCIFKLVVMVQSFVGPLGNIKFVNPSSIKSKNRLIYFVPTFGNENGFVVLLSSIIQSNIRKHIQNVHKTNKSPEIIRLVLYANIYLYIWDNNNSQIELVRQFWSPYSIPVLKVSTMHIEWKICQLNNYFYECTYFQSIL